MLCLICRVVPIEIRDIPAVKVCVEKVPADANDVVKHFLVLFRLSFISSASKK